MTTAPHRAGPPQEFLDVLSWRIAEYTGRHDDEVRTAVNHAGDRLPAVMADLMLRDFRVHGGDESDPDREWIRVRHDTARRRLIAQLGVDLASGAPAGGTAIQRRQQARIEAERVFGKAVDVVDPIALQCGVPRTVALQREALVAAGLASLRGLPADRVPDSDAVDRWLAAMEELHGPGGDDRAVRFFENLEGGRPPDGQRLVADVDKALRRAAGDGEYEPRTSTREPDLTLRDGIAVRKAELSRAELAAAYGYPDALDDVDGTLPDRFEGRMAAGFAQAIAARTGRSEAEVIDTLCSVGQRPGTQRHQWHAARRLLVPDESLEGVDDVDPRHVGELIVEAMRDEMRRHYGDPDRTPDQPADQVGARIAAAGAELARDLGVGPVRVVPEAAAAGRRDPGLNKALQVATVPRRDHAVGDREASPGATADQGSGQPMADRLRQAGSRTASTHQPPQL